MKRLNVWRSNWIENFFSPWITFVWKAWNILNTILQKYSQYKRDTYILQGSINVNVQIESRHFLFVHHVCNILFFVQTNNTTNYYALNVVKCWHFTKQESIEMLLSIFLIQFNSNRSHWIVIERKKNTIFTCECRFQLDWWLLCSRKKHRVHHWVLLTAQSINKWWIFCAHFGQILNFLKNNFKLQSIERWTPRVRWLRPDQMRPKIISTDFHPKKKTISSNFQIKFWEWLLRIMRCSQPGPKCPINEIDHKQSHPHSKNP